MKKRFLCLLLLAITLTAVLGASTHVHKVAAASYPVIYIQADGAIHPATANITSSDNVTYTFTGDIYASLVVQRDHIVVDGAGYTVHGNGSGTGIDISYLNNVTLQNVEVTNFTDGIHVNSVYVAVVDNTVLNNTYGIHVESSHHVTVVGNTVLNNTDGIFLQNSNYVTAIGNTVSSNTGVGITLWGSLYNTLSGNTATNNDIGIGLSNSQFSTITGNTATNNSYGVWIFSSSFNTIIGNTASDNGYGISTATYSSYNTITGNTATNNSEVGIYLWGSSDSNTITGNTASNNAAGILLHDSANLVTGNTISSNSQYGIWIYASGDNVLFHNNLLGNAKAIEVSSASPNVFDNGVEGNYWSNYTGVDSNHDGLGDTPHVINANNTDYHPLMGAFHSFNTSVGSYVAVTSNSTIDSFQHFVSNTTIRMHVSNTTASQTLGFCRIRIPYEVMSEPFSVTVDGANPTYWDYTLDDNGTHRWIYFEYAHSTKEVVIVASYPIIHIKADGAIEPVTAHITSSDNVTYTFTGDIYASLVVQRDHIVVDGAGYTVHGNGSGTGIDLSNRTDVALHNIEVSNFTYGICLDGSQFSTITGNTISSNNERGIYITNSSFNTITGNNASNNGIMGILLTEASNNNTVTGNTIFSNSIYGIYSTGSSYNIVAANTASSSRYGIFLLEASYDTVAGNTASNCEGAISLYNNSSSNIVASNTASSNERGIWIYDSSFNTITANNVSNNGCGLGLISSSVNNVLFHNNFIDNVNNVDANDNPNVFDNGVEGNYWSNYTGVDSNHDGLGDTPHVINANNTDYHPLMGTFHRFNTSLGKSVNIMSNSTVDSFQYELPGTIRFHVSNTTADQAYGFCRVSLPYDVLSPPFNVTIDGANPTYWDYTLDDNGTHRWIYFEYAHSTKEVVIVPEFPSAFILPLFIALSLLVTIAYRRKHAFKT